MEYASTNEVRGDWYVLDDMPIDRLNDYFNKVLGIFQVRSAGNYIGCITSNLKLLEEWELLDSATNEIIKHGGAAYLFRTKYWPTIRSLKFHFNSVEDFICYGRAFATHFPFIKSCFYFPPELSKHVDCHEADDLWRGCDIYEAPAVWSTAGPRLWPLAAIIRPGDVEELVPHDVRISASSTIEQQARWEGFWTPETKAVSERFLKVYREVTELGGIVRRDFDEAYERNPVALMEGRTMIVVRSFCGHRASYGRIETSSCTTQSSSTSNLLFTQVDSHIYSIASTCVRKSTTATDSALRAPTSEAQAAYFPIPHQIESLSLGLHQYVNVVGSLLKQCISMELVSGASGGFGAGLLFLRGKLRPSSEAINDNFRFDALFQEDWDVEGSIDLQSIQGKMTTEVARRAKANGAQVVALAGTIRSGADSCLDSGIEALSSILQAPKTLEAAFLDTPRLLREGAERLMRMIMVGMPLKLPSLVPGSRRANRSSSPASQRTNGEWNGQKQQDRIGMAVRRPPLESPHPMLPVRVFTF